MERTLSVKLLFTVEGLGSIGGNLMQVGIFFYTNRRFGWGLKENFTLAAAQGVVYTGFALTAQQLARRFEPRNVVAALYGILSLISLSTLLSRTPSGVVAAILAYTALVAAGWPILESMVSTGVSPQALGKRISAYNVVWAGTGALIIAVNGTIIDHWPSGVFVLTALVHGIASLLIVSAARGEHNRAAAPPLPSSTAHLNPEPELQRLRTLALWLSRISMPAGYALIYSLSALLPSLPPMQSISTTTATLIACTWLASRWVTFFALGQHTWWHTRPRVLLIAAWVMLVAFGVIAWQPSTLLGGLAIDLAWLVLCQAVLGVALGLIYSASLYFGMVLSEGSTEQSGYHEALIGLGSILGPGAGALAQWLRPGDTRFGVLAVSAVLWISTLLATGASLYFARRKQS